MGTFDTIKVKCPRCNFKVDFQTKAGKCNLDIYQQYSVPVTLAEAIRNDVEVCPNCGYSVNLQIPHSDRIAIKGI